MKANDKYSVPRTKQASTLNKPWRRDEATFFFNFFDHRVVDRRPKSGSWSSTPALCKLGSEITRWPEWFFQSWNMFSTFLVLTCNISDPNLLITITFLGTTCLSTTTSTAVSARKRPPAAIQSESASSGAERWSIRKCNSATPATGSVKEFLK